MAHIETYFVFLQFEKVPKQCFPLFWKDFPAQMQL